MASVLSYLQGLSVTAPAKLGSGNGGTARALPPSSPNRNAETIDATRNARTPTPPIGKIPLPSGGRELVRTRTQPVGVPDCGVQAHPCQTATFVGRGSILQLTYARHCATPSRPRLAVLPRAAGGLGGGPRARHERAARADARRDGAGGGRQGLREGHGVRRGVAGRGVAPHLLRALRRQGAVLPGLLHGRR